MYVVEVLAMKRRVAPTGGGYPKYAIGSPPGAESVLLEPQHVLLLLF